MCRPGAVGCNYRPVIVKRDETRRLFAFAHDRLHAQHHARIEREVFAAPRPIFAAERQPGRFVQLLAYAVAAVAADEVAAFAAHKLAGALGNR